VTPKSTFVTPGASDGTSPSLADTDGVKHAMLKAQRALNSPSKVRRHLRVHHKRNVGANPLAVHAQQHVASTMSQGHSVGVGGQLTHNTNSAGTENFANEAPGIVELTPHKQLLAARSSARSQYPQGHPVRLYAERAVRASRRASKLEPSDAAKQDQAHINDAKKLAEAKKDPAFYVPRGPEEAPAIIAPPPMGQPQFASVSEHTADIASLSPVELARYWSIRNEGAQHGHAISRVRSAPVRPTRRK
jgi:hypothetical protein